MGLAGWIGLTVAGALLHLLAVLARVRNLAVAMPAARPVRDRALVTVAAASIGALTLTQLDRLQPVAAPATALATAVALVLAGRIARLALRALPAGPRRPVTRARSK